ncbi:hypothetical protein, variant [Aphanomyces invadans]|uniref:Exocyst complex component n=1 Tax=Aphanomyces invadans TaxID=157072 RepID=A0A024TG95_9STRA|nr:hypothetical protein, variant [Aphanomyces invadans]ETV93185.1 hypothetical protein, variant [Aphanomyces invadans]|eukprot:XP_008878206.1 hypothetical protein, variant [Aphanomyces invadans]
MLESLPTNPFALIDHLQSEIGAMDIAKDVVTSKLAEDIQRNYHTFIQGMNHVQEVDLDLAQALIQVKNGRRLLAIHKKELVMSHLELVKLRRNRDRLQMIVDHSTSILECFKQEQEMLTLLHDKEYERAVRVSASMRNRVGHLKQFAVLRPSIHRMHQALPELRKHFHGALRDLLISFDGDMYNQLLHALAALDAEIAPPWTISQQSASEMPMKDVVDVVVKALDELARGAVGKLDAVIMDKSTSATIAMVATSVLDAYEAVANLVHNYDMFQQWHHSSNRADGGADDATSTKHEENKAADTYRRYRRLVWDTVQRRVGDAWMRLSWPRDTKMEHVVGLAHATETLVALGVEFCDGALGHQDKALPSLRSMFTSKAQVFFEQLLHDNVELMRMMVDTEKWERLAVTLAEDASTSVQDKCSASAAIWTVVESRCGYTLRHSRVAKPVQRVQLLSQWVNPFATAARAVYETVPSMEKYAAPALEQRDDDVDEDVVAIKRLVGLDPYLSGDPARDGDIVATPEQDELIRFGSRYVVTTWTYSGFLRVCGQYVKLMHELEWMRPILSRHLVAVFEFGLYAVLRRCTTDGQIQRLLARHTPTDLVCHHLREWVAHQRHVQAFPPPPIATDDDPNETNTFVNRVLAMETVAFQWLVLSIVAAPPQERCLDNEADRHRALGAVVQEARAYVYAGLVPPAIQASAIPPLIANASWDIAHMSTQHNEYVVTLVRNCGMFWGTLQGSAVPIAVRDELWAVVVRAVMEALVDGYANVPKCSTEGRALMSMDLMALQNGLDLVNHASNLPPDNRWGRAYVHNYIKAYYFQEPELLAFIDANKLRYRKSHLVRLATDGVCGKLRKPAHKDLMHKIEQLYRDAKASDMVASIASSASMKAPQGRPHRPSPTVVST